jgi:hypothetical protein
VCHEASSCSEIIFIIKIVIAQASHWFRFVSFFVQFHVIDDDHSKDTKVVIAVGPRLVRVAGSVPQHRMTDTSFYPRPIGV